MGSRGPGSAARIRRMSRNDEEPSCNRCEWAQSAEGTAWDETPEIDETTVHPFGEGLETDESWSVDLPQDIFIHQLGDGVFTVNSCISDLALLRTEEGTKRLVPVSSGSSFDLVKSYAEQRQPRLHVLCVSVGNEKVWEHTDQALAVILELRHMCSVQCALANISPTLPSPDISIFDNLITNADPDLASVSQKIGKASLNIMERLGSLNRGQGGDPFDESKLLSCTNGYAQKLARQRDMAPRAQLLATALEMFGAYFVQGGFRTLADLWAFFYPSHTVAPDIANCLFEPAHHTTARTPNYDLFYEESCSGDVVLHVVYEDFGDVLYRRARRGFQERSLSCCEWMNVTRKGRNLVSSILRDRWGEPLSLPNKIVRWGDRNTFASLTLSGRGATSSEVLYLQDWGSLLDVWDRSGEKTSYTKSTGEFFAQEIVGSSRLFVRYSEKGKHFLSPHRHTPILTEVVRWMRDAATALVDVVYLRNSDDLVVREDSEEVKWLASNHWDATVEWVCYPEVSSEGVFYYTSFASERYDIYYDAKSRQWLHSVYVLPQKVCTWMRQHSQQTRIKLAKKSLLTSYFGQSVAVARSLDFQEVERCLNYNFKNSLLLSSALEGSEALRQVGQDIAELLCGLATSETQVAQPENMHENRSFQSYASMAVRLGLHHYMDTILPSWTTEDHDVVCQRLTACFWAVCGALLADSNWTITYEIVNPVLREHLETRALLSKNDLVEMLSSLRLAEGSSCVACNLLCNGPQQYKDHLAGKKHKKRCRGL